MVVSRNYPKDHLQSLYNMREEDQLCDVTIHVGGRKFRAHKNVLAASGDYFLAMFTSGFKEGSAQEITIEGSAAAFEVLLHFVYTAEVRGGMLASCMYEVLEMASYMHLTEFAKTCSSALQNLLDASTSSQVSVGDVCKVMLFAQRYTHYDYVSALYQSILKYFEDQVESLKCLDMFLVNISATFLQEFLSRENLSNADEEDHVLELVINWLKRDWEKRKGYSHQLLQKVRLGLVAPEVIKKLIDPEILEIPGCSELVNYVLDLEASKPKEILAVENPDIASPRSSIMAPLLLNYVGKFEFYDPNAKYEKWVTLDKFDTLPSKTERHELVVVKGVLYAAGGADGKEFHMYHASKNKWVPLPSKPIGERQFLQLVSLGAYIYAFGTCWCFEEDGVIERYDIDAKKWEVLKKVQKRVPGPSISWFSLVAATEEIDDCFCTRHPYRRPDNKHGMSHGVSAVVFEGKVFVSISRQMISKAMSYHDRYYIMDELMIFDPTTMTCQLLELSTRLEEPYDHDYHDNPLYFNWEETQLKPTLFIFEDHLYRMIIEYPGDCRSEVYVSKLSITQEEDGKMKVELGEELREDKRPLADLRNETPFYVQDKIFDMEPASSIGNQVVEPGNSDALLPEYRQHQQLFSYRHMDRNPVWFSFQKNKLMSKKWPYY